MKIVQDVDLLPKAVFNIKVAMLAGVILTVTSRADIAIKPMVIT